MKLYQKKNMLRNTMLLLAFLFINYSCAIESNLNDFSIKMTNKASIDSICKEISNKTNTTKTEEKKFETEDRAISLNWSAIFQDSLSNIIGGLLFAIIIFFLNEYIFKTKNVSGEWKMNIKITDSSYRKYIDLGIEYKVHLLQLGNQISGRGEKVKDINPDGSDYHIYPNEKRIDIEITGYYEKNYLKSSKLYLLIKENGSKRTTSASYTLTLPFFRKDKFTGLFISTAADSRGNSTWQRSILS